MLLISFILLVSLVIAPELAFPLDGIETEWHKFQVKFDRHYEDLKELAFRKKIFTDNLKAIWQHNAEYDAGRSSSKHGVNQFTDRTLEELNLSLCFMPLSISEAYKYSIHQVNVSGITDSDIPEAIDYRKLRAVSLVKNQGKCASCWAFATVGSIEGAAFLATKKLVTFSEQRLVDCSGRNQGCHGGMAERASKDLQEMGGITTAESYPYRAVEQTCQYNKKVAVARIKDFNVVENSSPDVMKKALAMHGPLAAVVEVTANFRNYSGGILSDDKCTGDLHHAILVVGYASESGIDYWIVKNSWGQDWGEDGYIRLSHNKSNCIQPSYPSFPIVTPNMYV